MDFFIYQEIIYDSKFFAYKSIAVNEFFFQRISTDGTVNCDDPCHLTWIVREHQAFLNRTSSGKTCSDGNALESIDTNDCPVVSDILIGPSILAFLAFCAIISCSEIKQLLKTSDALYNNSLSNDAFYM